MDTWEYIGGIIDLDLEPCYCKTLAAGLTLYIACFMAMFLHW